MEILFMMLTLLLSSVYADRFLREELGISDRLRFTCGHYNVYNCTIKNNILYSNLKIGMYLHNHKTKVKYYINDTVNFRLETSIIKDFLFAVIKVKGQNGPEAVHLFAKNVDSRKVIDDAILKIHSSKSTNVSPKFLNDSITTIQVFEDTFIGSAVGRLMVDTDGVFPVVFHICKEHVRLIDKFSVSTAGSILLTKNLDYNVKRRYQFKVCVSPLGSNLIDSILIKITVVPSVKQKKISLSFLRNTYIKSLLNVKTSNWLQPVRTFTFYLSINEFAPTSTIIGCVNAGYDNLTFEIKDNLYKNVLALNAKSGILSVKDSNNIDYESRKFYRFSVLGTTGNELHMIATVHLNVLDANDNTPVFSKSKFVANISESTEAGSFVLKLEATDRDSFNNGTVNFVLSNELPVPFEVSYDGVIKVSQKLDLLTMTDIYYLYVKAIDSGERQRLESEAVVEIHINPVNSHEPIMMQSKCEVFLTFDSTSGDIFTFNAVDQDIGDKLFYKLKTESELFQMNSNGTLKLIKDISPENAKEITLHVVASDGIHESKKSVILVKFKNSKRNVRCNQNVEYTKVMVQIKARKTFTIPTIKPPVSVKPEGTILFVTAPKSIVVPENADTHRKLTQFHATDSDRNCYGIILYTIQSGNDNGKFQIDLFNGTLYLLNKVDRESKGFYVLKIKASDLHGHSTTKSVEVIIDDVNDNAPIFTNNSFYEIRDFNEEKSVKSIIFTVTAKDPDFGSNGKVTYSLVNPSQVFKLNEVTGDLQVITSLENYPYNEYFVEVKASDQSQEHSMYSFAVVHIITKANEYSQPLCLTDRQQIEVPINMPEGVVVGRVFGYENSYQKHGLLKYSIVDSSVLTYFHDYFSLDEDTGLIKLKRSLSQKEKGFVFNIAVKISDGKFRTKCHLYKIIVDSYSVNKLQFINHDTYPKMATISEDVSKSSLVTHLHAFLNDNSSEAIINYELVDGSGIGIFAVDRLIGSIYVQNNDFSKSFYWLTVQAYLDTDASVFVNTHLLISIKDTIIKQLFFNPSVYHVTLHYTLNPKQFVVQLYSTNGRDEYNSQESNYAIYAGDERDNFMITGDGQIYTNKVLPVGQFKLNITVCAKSNSSSLSHGFVTVDIISNMMKPVFFDSGTMRTVNVFETEGSSNPPFLFQPLAHNPNGEHTRLIYTISDEEKFKIDARTGVVTADLLKANDIHFVSITASNYANQTADIFYMVNVIKKPATSKKFSFKKQRYLFTIKENSDNLDILDLSKEVDHSSEVVVFFYILSGNDDLKFFIAPGSAQLAVLQALDYEQQQQHVLQILAFDGKVFAKTYVQIMVTNLNDNPLTVSQPCFEARLQENTISKSRLITVQVIDPDRFDSGFNYVLINNLRKESPFYVSQDGAISVKSGLTFDREVQNEHIATVVAGSENDNATYCVKVLVEDLNDNKPNFTKSLYRFNVYDTADVGFDVAAVYAYDKDTGSNARLTYRLKTQSSLFSIIGRTGVIIVKNSLLEESGKIVTLDVEVSDGGQPSFSLSCKVQINILTDLKKLTFAQSLYRFEIKENLQAGSLVSNSMRVNVSSVYYEISKKESECYQSYWIDYTTGVLLTSTVLDFEEIQNCSFVVVGLLHGKVVASADVSVEIIDMNDNAPIFMQESYIGSCEEGKKSNSKVFTSDRSALILSAKDKDSGENGRLKYSFVEETTTIYFVINEDNGEILTNMVLDYENHPHKFEFHVIAIDQGNPSYSAIVPVTIMLVNINDKMPTFWKPDVVNLLLPTYNGAIVYRLSALDADMLPNTTLIYGIAGSNGIFDVNSITGDVFIKDESLLVDQEFTVIRPTVSDGIFKSETNLQFQLSRYNPDSKFRFLSTSINASIVEHMKSVQLVTVLNPVGYDPGEQLKYKIINTAPNFHIDPLSGIMSTSALAVFDRESVNSYVIHVEVSKKDCVNVVARTSVIISVDDVNDNAPVFSQQRYYRAVNIDSLGGVPLLTVHATDADLGENAMIRYRLLSNEEYFDCNELSGVIVLQKAFIKSQTKPKYILKVQAFDNGTNILSSEAVIEIPVINKDQPMFTNNYNIIVSEDAQIGQKLMQIKARGRQNRQVYYYISHGDVYDQFAVGFTTGELTVSGHLDYSVQSSYSLTIKAIDSLTGSWSEAECNIQIIDINNHSPKFEQSAYTVNILENAPIGSLVIKLSANDGDHGSNARLSYSLISQSNSKLAYFDIDTQTGLITLRSGLDAETLPYHQLSVIVTDQGVPRQSSFTTLTVHVIDINDNPPEFVDQHYEFIVDSYSVSDKQFIGKVHAVDRDVNDKLSYSLNSKNELISMDDQSGSLYVIAHPKHSKALKLNVNVSDTIHHVSTIVDIHFTAQNRFAPVMKKKLWAAVKEGSGLTREVVTVLKAVDNDQGMFGHVSYQIDAQSDGEYFMLDENGILHTNGKLFDREKQDMYFVNARATDNGGLFALTTVFINVTDSNDNTPIFEFSHYHSNVMTSQMSADSLLHVIAHDPDEGSNSELTYTTEIGSQGNPIIIDKLNGLVSLAGSPKGAMYQFPVKATDNGFPVRESLSAEVQISVKGWSDLLFSFSNDSYHAEVPENTSLKKVLVNVAVLQNRFNGSVRYSLKDGNLDYTKASHYFKINSKSGKIKLIKMLDYETIPYHKLMVQATTVDGEYLAMCFVHIQVKNINDNTPKFLPRKYDIQIPENIRVNKRILKVISVDKDQPSNKLRYSFEYDQTFFSIDSSSGWIRVIRKLDHEKQSIYQLIVKVFDEDEKSDTAKVIINVVDINDSPPHFLQLDYSFAVPQDTLPGEHFSCVKAKDADVGGILNYFIGSSMKNDEFAVDIASGCIRLLKPMAQQSYNVTLLAYDGVHTTSVKVEIQSINNNQNYPHCSHSYYNVSAKENIIVGSSLAKIVAEDKDVGDVLSYAIQGDGVGKFKVVQETGVLVTTGLLDFESNMNYRFKVVVADRADHSCMSDIFLTLLDINDNAPTFSQNLFIATVRENATKSVVITQVKAIDLDSFENRKITYQLLRNFDDVFAIGDRGIVTLNKPSFIRQNRISNYTMLVKATDSGQPSLSSTVNLQVIVLSVKDTPPRFEKLSYVFAIKENRPRGTLAGTIKANAMSNLKTEVVLTKIINDPSGIFKLTNEGKLMVMQSLDFEDKSTYSFNVKAWFAKIPSLSSMVNVEIQVIDVNDHTPTFLKKSYFKQIDENLRPGTFVLQAFATDTDGSMENSQLTYQIVHQGLLPFAINPITGVIAVNGSIDYERRQFYSFHVLAEDSSSPKLSANVPVMVNITDLNDNAPTLSETNASVIIQEGKLPGSTLLKLGVTDLDSSSNAAPFACELLLGDAEKFEVVTENDLICVLRSKTLFKVTEKALYELSIRVSDSGSPKRYSDSSVKIIIVEESYHQPVIQGPKMFFVIVSKPYGVTKVGKVNIFDKDENDVHQFKITNGNRKTYFSIQPMTGIIEGKPFKGTYSLSIEVSDGKFTDSRLFHIVVNEIDKDVKIKSVPIILSGVDAKQFIDYKMHEFIVVLARLTATKPDDVFIWSVKDYYGLSARQKRSTLSSQIMIAVAVHNPTDKDIYMERANLKTDIMNGLQDFETIDIEVSIPSLECTRMQCPAKQLCLVSLTPEDEIVSLHMPSGYMNFKKEEKCYCEDGSEGPLCYPRNSCVPNPCKLGERCVLSATKYHCECVDGRYCDKTADSSSIMLDGTSYVSYQLREDFDVFFNSLSMHFRTEMESNILFYAFGKDFFIVEIEFGYINVRFDFGSGVGSLRNKKRYVSDGNWHKIIITRSKNFVTLTLDDGKMDDSRAPGDSANINVNGHGIVFGAGVSRDGSPFSGFKGCMKGIKLSGNILPYSGSNDFIQSVDVRRVKFGCQDSNMCAVKHCGSFADCINTITSYRCVCVKGHFGPSCTSDYTCANMPCQNHGTCTYELVAGKVSYKCNCMHGFTGAQCHIPLKACAQKPCLNGGKCTSLSSTAYTCECLSGYTGTNCEVNEHPCQSNPCYNGAKCINLFNDYKCNCQPVNKRGKQCAAGEYCKHMQCQNGGSCIELQDGGECSCEDGYTGAFCEQDINECLIDTPCINGAGICVNTHGSYYCNCSDGTIGKTCAAAVTRQEKGLPLVIIAAGGGGFILLVIICILVVCFVKKRRKKRSDMYNSRNASVERKYPLDRYQSDTYELVDMYPPNPPPRGFPAPPNYFDGTDQASGGMCPMVTFSGSPSQNDCIKQKLRLANRLADSDMLDDDDLRYHWDYSEVPEDVINSKMSREGSRIGLTKTDQYYPEEGFDYVDIPKIPERPASRRSSIPGYSECETDIPELPELPNQVRLSRQSLRSGTYSPSTLPRLPPDLTSREFQNRYSLMSDEDDNPYFHENEANMVYTKPYVRTNYDSGTDIDDDQLDDGYTVTSMNSDDEDDATETDPLDPENTRKLEREIKKLFKDLQKRTEED